MVEPMPSLTCNDEPIDLVGFDPNDFIYSIITPLRKTLTAELHGSSSDPKENQTLILKYVNS